jgi:hypothetical protein
MLDTRKKIYVVTDIETTHNFRPNATDQAKMAGMPESLQLAFDVAWKAVDKKGKVYCEGSYVATDIFNYAIPFFRQKLGLYFEDAYNHNLAPRTYSQIRDLFNADMADLDAQGFNVILCAYNAVFDFSHLQQTSEMILNGNFLDTPRPILDIWHTWGMSVPVSFAKTAARTKSGMYFATTAEAAYAFEIGNSEFIERHVAYDDVNIETEVLLKALKRSNSSQQVLAMSPQELPAMPWRDINEFLQKKFPITEIAGIGNEGELPVYKMTRDYQDVFKIDFKAMMAESRALETA